ncbi:MAG: PilX N-terminal domain-containing pilus assembly protein [Caldimonas sp.]
MNDLIHRSPHRQRGAAALLVTTLLCFAMLLVVAYAHRNVVVEERASANQLRAAQAFEAAEAGIEWALSRLNDPTPAGPDCRPSSDASAQSARDRWLRFQGAAGEVVPVTWSHAGTPTPLRAACVRGDGGWTCSCPVNGAPSLAAPAGQATAPTFAVEFTAGPRPGIVRIASTGCTRSDVACAAAAEPTANHAVARVEASFALLPALR